MSSLFQTRVVAVLLASAACTAPAFAQDSDELMVKASKLTKLTTAVESTVRYKDPPANLTETELLALSVEHDPSLLSPFEGHTMRVLSKDRHAAVLVCNQDGSRGLLEDVGCTAEMDRHQWRDDPTAACQFTVDLDSICAARVDAVSAEVTSASASISEATNRFMIEIAEAVWTREVDPATRKPSASLQSSPARTPLTLWMRIKGYPEAIHQLEHAGKLPIKHRWFRESFSGVTAEGITEMTDSITLSAGKKELLAGLRHETEQRGFFDWRTWSTKSNTGKGRWSIAVVYADNTPVLCGEETRKPCRYFITVK